MGATVRPITLQIGPFAIIPLWLIQRCSSGDALRLYGWLAAKYCAGHDLECWPTQAVLSEDLSRSVDRIQQDLKLLRDLGAVETERVIGASGQLERLKYNLVQLDPTLNRENAVQGVGLNRTSTATQPQIRGSNKEIQTQVPIPKSTEAVEGPARNATEQYLREHPELRPAPRVPKKRTGKHATHVFCGSYFCVDAEKHARFEKRWLVAAGDDDLDLLGTYKDIEKDFETSGSTSNPAFFLEKAFTQLLENEFGRDQARA